MIVAGKTKDTFTIATVSLIFSSFDLISQFFYSYIYTIRAILNFKIAQRVVKEVTEILKKTQIASALNCVAGIAIVFGIMLYTLRNGSSTDQNIQSLIRESLPLVLLCIVFN